MHLFGNFRDISKNKYYSDEMYSDFKNGKKIGRVTIGKLYFYYKDLGRKYYVPYDYIIRMYTKVEVVMPDDSPAIEYYRLMLNDGTNDFANLIFNKDSEIKAIYEIIRQEYPQIIIGYKD